MRSAVGSSRRRANALRFWSVFEQQRTCEKASLCAENVVDDPERSLTPLAVIFGTSGHARLIPDVARDPEGSPCHGPANAPWGKWGSPQVRNKVLESFLSYRVVSLVVQGAL
jgi:hypothetical protein